MRETKKRSAKKRRPLNVSQAIALIFFAVIIAGTVLLMMPFSSRSGESRGFLTALFTATSATCVTGLVAGDTWTLWSGFGQAVILCMIEIGGLGFMSIASSVIFVFRKKLSMNELSAVASSVGSDDMSEVIRVQRKTLLFSLSAEALGAVILTLRFLGEYGFPRAVSLGVFHSVSAFCNAGFDIFGFRDPGGSMALYHTDTVVVLTLSFLIVFGGIGYLVWDEVFSKRSPKKWSVYTKLVLITTGALLVSGTILIYIAEQGNSMTLLPLSFADKLKAGFFQSVTTRTAGFAGMDQGMLTDAGKAVSMFLMLIGGGSCSTAGGLKTVTFIVLALFLLSRLRGKEHIHVFNRNIPDRYVLNALTVFSSVVFLSFFGGAFISLTSPVSFTDALFESISAIATVGLTAGATPHLSVASKILIIIYMYFGRVGILTISLGFLQGARSRDNFKYADTGLLIG